MNLSNNTKIGLGFAIAVIGAGFWWAATITNDIEYIKQDLAIIKTLIAPDHIVKK